MSKKYDSKVANLVKKFNIKKGKIGNRKEQEEDELLEGILLEDKDLEAAMKDETGTDIPKYGLDGSDLDSDEVALLRKHPKFAVFDKIDLKKIKEEIEVACVKIRWNRRNSGYKEEEEVVEGKEKAEEENVIELEAREIFDPERKTLNMGKRVATDIKTNQRIYLPGPRPAKEEAEMLVRKDIWESTIKQYIMELPASTS